MTAAEVEMWAALAGVAVCVLGLSVVGFLYWRSERKRVQRPALPALPIQPARDGFCPDCWTPPGMPHELSCPEVSAELALAYIEAVSR